MPAGGLMTAGIIGAGTNLLGGIFGKNAATSAAKTQAAAAKAAGEQVVATTAGVNPTIGAAATRAGTAVTGTAGDAGTAVTGAGTEANALLNPFAKTGSQAADELGTRLDELTKTPGMSDLQIDPGFQFRLEQAEKALANSAAARGGALSGAAQKSLDRYVQGDASQEYAAAFQRYKQNQLQNYNILQGTAGMGLNAAGKEGENLIGTNEWAGGLKTQASEFAGNADINAANAMAMNTINASRAQGDYLTGAAAATAAGKVGGTNALTAGLTGASGSIMNALTIGDLLKSKAATNTYVPPNVDPTKP